MAFIEDEPPTILPRGTEICVPVCVCSTVR
jgi:hypothetical protein